MTRYTFNFSVVGKPDTESKVVLNPNIKIINNVDGKFVNLLNSVGRKQTVTGCSIYLSRGY